MASAPWCGMWQSREAPASPAGDASGGGDSINGVKGVAARVSPPAPGASQMVKARADSGFCELDTKARLLLTGRYAICFIKLKCSETVR